uniref:Junction-mediating and -regulatory protein-like n=1 Tax=Nicotiana tabacum TaxID=4097 RepID=A0A1S3ZGE4_TOBAC
MKVQCRGQLVGETTWEIEQEIQNKYPHQFETPADAITSAMSWSQKRVKGSWARLMEKAAEAATFARSAGAATLLTEAEAVQAIPEGCFTSLVGHGQNKMKHLIAHLSSLSWLVRPPSSPPASPPPPPPPASPPPSPATE